MDHSGRLRRLQAVLPEHKLDWFLVTHFPNIRYLSGFTGSAGILLINDDSATLFTDGRYRTQAREEVSSAKIVIVRKSPRSPPQSSSPELAPGRHKKVGLEPQSVTISQRDQISAILRGKWKLISVPPLIERSRMVKDREEVRRIRAAIELGASLFKIARRKIRPGVKEVEVAAAMEFEARRSGAEGMSFSTIIAAGKRSAVVHGRASEARIPRRGFVLCDSVLYSPVIVRTALVPCT